MDLCDFEKEKLSFDRNKKRGLLIEFNRWDFFVIKKYFWAEENDDSGYANSCRQECEFQTESSFSSFFNKKGKKGIHLIYFLCERDDSFLKISVYFKIFAPLVSDSPISIQIRAQNAVSLRITSNIQIHMPFIMSLLKFLYEKEFNL